MGGMLNERPEDQAGARTMIRDIKLELTRLEIARTTLRNFGLLFFAVFGVWTGLLVWKGSSQWPWPAAAAFGFLITGLFFPAVLRRPYELWMLLAIILGWFTTRIILVIAYVVIMSPMGWLLRRLGKDVLDEQIDKDAATYWKKHEPLSGKEQYKKQF